MQFDFKITTLTSSGNNLPQHKLWMALLGTRVARAETDLLKGFESLSYGEHNITLVNLHNSRGGMGVFQWKCWVSALMPLPGVLHRGCNWGVHTFIKNYPDRQTEQIRDEGGRNGTQATQGLHRLSFHSVRAFVHLSTEPLSPALPSWPPHCAGCLQSNSSCQGCIPDPSAPAVRAYVLNLHSAFFFTHLKKGSPRQAINTIAQLQGVGGRLLKAPLPATIVRELRTEEHTCKCSCRLQRGHVED